jgi:hypothetical protein
MVDKECNLRAGVYQVQTFGTTQTSRDAEKFINLYRSYTYYHIYDFIYVIGEIPMEINASVDMKPLTLPPLVWVAGTVYEILVQPGEQFYVFAIKPAKGSGVILRIADAHTGAPMSSVTTGNLVYDLMKEAYFRKLNVQVAYRDFGQDPQSGINKLCIDRVILTQ